MSYTQVLNANSFIDGRSRHNPPPSDTAIQNIEFTEKEKKVIFTGKFMITSRREHNFIKIVLYYPYQ